MQEIIDNHGRPINYLRLAITDRCNLRCFYCMPAHGIQYLPKKEMLTYEEMERIITLMASMGITKVRITGGEPFLRKDLIHFLEQLSNINGITEWNITTNGVLTTPYIPKLLELGVGSVNLSLDTLDSNNFLKITRRNEYDKVRETLDALIAHKIPTKINMVVMDGQNTDEIISMAELTKDSNIDVRYIEEMPFNGTQNGSSSIHWNYKKIFDQLVMHYPKLMKLPDPANATANHYQVPGYSGKLGIIAAYSRTFCGSCNRIRLTSQGIIKTCLYDEGKLDLKGLIRSGATDNELKAVLTESFTTRYKDGFIAEASRTSINESMSEIGG